MHPLNECELACKPCENTIADRLKDIIDTLYQLHGVSESIGGKLFGDGPSPQGDEKELVCINDYANKISNLVNEIGKALSLTDSKL